MGSMSCEPEGFVFDPEPLFSRRVQRWEPGASTYNPRQLLVEMRRGC